MKIEFFIVVVIGLCSVTNVAIGGFTEEIGGYKARLSVGDVIEAGIKGERPSNSNDEHPMEYYYDLGADDKAQLIIAARMAECGYPDERNDMWKEGTGYHLLGMESSQGENDQNLEREELNKILANSDKSFRLRVYDQPLYKTVNGKRVKPPDEGPDMMLTITGKDADRLSARILKKADGTIAVVFCGTDWGEGGISIHGDSGDARDDAKQLTHLAPTPLAYKEAAELLRAVKATYPTSNIEVFGHSEGGGMAQYAVLHSGILETARDEPRTIKCYGVNSAGLNGLESVNDLKDELKGDDRKEHEKNKAIVKKYTEENFTLIQNEGEWCSRLGYQFGRFVRVETKEFNDANNNAIVVTNHYGTPVILNNMNKQHGVEETRLKMEYDYNTGDEETKEEKKEVAEKITEKKQESDEDKKTDTENEKEPNPFDSNPFDSKPEDDGNGQVCPIPGNNNTTPIRTKPTPRYRGGRGGGDTKAVIWP